MITIAFFNGKGDMGKTSLAYHLAWMYADLGLNVVAVDVDPQASLSAMFLDEYRLSDLWPESGHGQTVLGAIEPLLTGVDDIRTPHVEHIADAIGLVVGDLGLARFEEALSAQWPLCLDGEERALRALSAFSRLLVAAAEQRAADVVLIDVGPNLGAINRAALICADDVVIPLAPDLFSLQGLRNLGPTVRAWREGWAARLPHNPAKALHVPRGEIKPVGYVILQHALRLDRPVQAYARWMAQIPRVYQTAVLGVAEADVPPSLTVENDTECCALLKNYRSLMPLAMEARKPMFALKPADGAIGAHATAARSCYHDFRRLAIAVADRCGLPLPETARY